MKARHQQDHSGKLGGVRGGSLRPISEAIARVVKRQDGARRLNAAPLLAVSGLLALDATTHLF